jgi:hypothetical protein
MFKGAGQSVRRLHRVAGGSYQRLTPGRTALLASSAVLASALWYSQHPVHNDASLAFSPEKKSPEWSPDGISFHNKSDTLHTLVWGSNRCAACSLACYNLKNRTT